MVIRLVRVIKERISFEICPILAPKAATIRENSPICATVSPARKPVFLVNPSRPIKIMTIRGFPIRINNENTTAGRINELTLPIAIWAPKSRKNEIIKKSLSGLSLELISR